MQIPIPGQPSDNPLVAAAYAAGQAASFLACNYGPTIAALAAGKLTIPTQILAYVGATAILSRLCPNGPQYPPPVGPPGGGNPRHGCEPGRVYRLYFNRYVNLIEVCNNGIVSRVPQSVFTPDFVDFFGPWPGGITRNPNQSVTAARLRTVFNQQGLPICQGAGTFTWQGFNGGFFIDGFGIRRSVGEINAPNPPLHWQLDVLGVFDFNPSGESCQGGRPDLPTQFLPPLNPGANYPPSEPISFPVNLPFPGFPSGLPIILPLFPRIDIRPTFAPNININLGGVNFPISIGPQGDLVVDIPSPFPDFYPPSPDGNGGQAPFQPNDGGGGEVDECLVEKICNNFSVEFRTDSSCEGVDDDIATNTGEVSGLQGVAEVVKKSTEHLVKILREKCPSVTEFVEIGEGEITQPEQIDYAAIPEGFRGIMLQITQYDEAKINVYRLAGSELEGKFGWLSVAVGVNDSATRQYVITRKTEMPLPYPGEPAYARISLRVGTSYTLFGYT